MKNNWLRQLLTVAATASVIGSGTAAKGQAAAATNPLPAATVAAPAPQLGYGVQQILQLAQAKVGDDTIVAFIRNSGNSYNLNADQIIYLRQQGISDAVVTAMLNQPRAGVALTLPTTPAPEPVAAMAPPAQTPEVVYYSQPYYDPYYYDAGYYWYPPVTIGWGWGWGWGGRGYGYYRGYHGGYGGFRGGGFRSGGIGGGGHVGGFGGGGHAGTADRRLLRRRRRRAAGCGARRAVGGGQAAYRPQPRRP